jgi:hypothetical protein
MRKACEKLTKQLMENGKWIMENEEKILTFSIFHYPFSVDFLFDKIDFDFIFDNSFVVAFLQKPFYAFAPAFAVVES